MYKKVLHYSKQNLFKKWEYDYVIEYDNNGHILNQYSTNYKEEYIRRNK